jgi:tartrate-resistant acid phosphatase type 5
MRRTNAVTVHVDGPDKGLVTAVPSDLPDKARNRAIVIAKNVRAEFGVLRNAPGYERVVFDPRNLDSAPNLIFQANILNGDEEIRTTPIIGTSSKLFALLRRSRELTCDASGHSCPLTVGFIGDSGRVGSDLESVANLVKGWTPDLIVHTGDMAYASGTVEPTINDFEECIGQYFHEYLGGYNGIYGVGPATNKFFPTLGNHDWDDGGINNYLDFFQLPHSPNERYFHYKRGPIHFIHISGYTAEEPDGTAVGSTQYEWFADVAANSDCPWVIAVVHFPPFTSDSNYYPGVSPLDEWPWEELGVSAVVSGHSHNLEVVKQGSVYFMISGAGGHSLRSFNATPVDGSEWRYNDDYGALRLDATRSDLTWRFYDKSATLLHTVTMDNPRAGASGICYIGDAARNLFTLEVRPANAAVEVGYTWPFEAYAHYEDGSVENVTLESSWSSGDVSIASVGSNSGIATGVGAGTTTITAEFNGQTDSGNLTVLHSCLDDAMEVVFAVGRNESTASTADGASRLQHIKDGLELCAQGFEEGRDYLGLVSFAGDFDAQTEDSTTDQTLTTDFTEFGDKVAILSSGGTGSSVAEALQDAYDEITSSRHDASRRRAIVLIVDGPGTVVDPGGTSASMAAAVAAAMAAATTIADTIKAAGIRIVVIGYAVASSYQAGLTALASTGYDWFVSTSADLRLTLALLANSFCMADGYYYSYTAPDPTDCSNPVFDFFGFTNWDVTRGCVDLVGEGLSGVRLMDVLPGNGLYVDLAGTEQTVALPTPFGDRNARIESKTAFSFTEGKEYKLSFYMAGWNVSTPATGTPFNVEVEVENMLGVQTVTISDRFQPFTLYEYEFTAPITGTGKIIFDQQTYKGMVGLLLDRVMLENLTDATTMFYDDFDTENPC